MLWSSAPPRCRRGVGERVCGNKMEQRPSRHQVQNDDDALLLLLLLLARRPPRPRGVGAAALRRSRF